MRPEYDFKSGVRGKYAKRHCRDGFVAGERDAKIIERNLKSLNKQARDVMSYQVPMSRLEKGYLAMAMDEERRTMLPERKEGLEKKDKDKQKRLARECAKCDPREEKAMAEEVMRTSPPAAKPRQEWARRFRDAIRKERAAEYPENRAAKGSRSGFEQALKKVRDARPARKDAL